MAERNDTKAKNIAALERKLKDVKSETAKKALKAKIDRLKTEMKSGDKDMTAKQLADRLLRAKKRIGAMTSKEFNEMIKRLSTKPEYGFLKSMSKGEIQDDLARKAKPVGWRFKGRKNMKKPSSKQVREGRKDGSVYFENRPNRSDVSRVAQLGEGGKTYSEAELEEIASDYAYATGGDEEKAIWRLQDPDYTNTLLPQYISAIKEWEKKYDRKIGSIDYAKFKGGGALESADYVANRNIKEITLLLRGELKKVKGSDVFEGVHVKSETKASASPSVAKLKSRIIAYAKEHGDEAGNGYASSEDQAKKFVKDADLKAMRKGGLNDEMIMAFYCGIRSVIDFKGDYEMGKISGIFSMGDEYIPREIKKAVAAAKNKEFELGMKYPHFNWATIKKKYGLGAIKTVKGKEKKWGDEKETYIYGVSSGKKLSMGRAYERIRILADGEKDVMELGAKDPFADGGYLGLVSSDPNVLWDVIKTVAKQSDGYVKDLDFPLNGLGGIYPDPLKKNDIEFKVGGTTPIGGRKHLYKDENVILEFNPVGETYSLKDAKTGNFMKLECGGEIMEDGGEVKGYEGGGEVHRLDM